MLRRFDVTKIEGFEWDRGNVSKNWLKHRVTAPECEEVFFNKPLLVQRDAKHSSRERRFWALGKTHTIKYLFIAFTIRKNHIRVISARSQNRKERVRYQKVSKKEE